MAEALEAAGLWPTKKYIYRQQDTIAEYIANLPIYELCMGAERMPVSSKFMRRWDRDLTWEEEGDGSSEGAERELGWYGEILS